MEKKNVNYRTSSFLFQLISIIAYWSLYEMNYWLIISLQCLWCHLLSFNINFFWWVSMFQNGNVLLNQEKHDSLCSLSLQNEGPGYFLFSKITDVAKLWVWINSVMLMCLSFILSLFQRIYRLLIFRGHPFYSQAQNICKLNLLACTIR